jgi:hypothetical protein
MSPKAAPTPLSSLPGQNFLFPPERRRGWQVTPDRFVDGVCAGAQDGKHVDGGNGFPTFGRRNIDGHAIDFQFQAFARPDVQDGKVRLTLQFKFAPKDRVYTRRVVRVQADRVGKIDPLRPLIVCKEIYFRMLPTKPSQSGDRCGNQGNEEKSASDRRLKA